ncbi:hypothetical protein HCU64_23720 [Methylobacterium sp. C25]|uniref:hypothetical protein n=1 Tax=Methylobacterium sp. C25 TaxID=2721622 RepID=UPI001F2CE77F|nr:hypothetical protein [Methylobacterium sp. C25]MCE4226754.1 hypothetical protein [Methylobacterium sp. C25]
MMTAPKLLTESEVAERLLCSVSKVRQLRYKGLLPYLPGRPPLIAEPDFKAALKAELAKVSSRKARARQRRQALETANPPSQAEIDAEATAAMLAKLAASRRRAQIVSLQRRTAQQERERLRKLKLDGET